VPWEHLTLQPTGEAKGAPAPDRPFRLIYVGALIESKGVGDCIEAVAIVNARHAKVELTLVGAGEVDHWVGLVRERRVEASIRLLGVIPAEEVLTQMRENDAVVVPSRYDYSEGLPNTVYEALASRSPLIASDHPAFVERLRPAVDSLRFKAGRPQELAAEIERLIHEPGLYARLSRESASALSRLYVGIELTELFTHFINDPLNHRGWVNGYTLTALGNRIDGTKS
jgi:glycosyltransferase involved in cell wall biosynthesis